ncbi:MAG: MraY family glycosyltransferase [Planctomycetia bacterium]|nr:MraY family glycosyltransferase [Planctomycetia bacterium]
MIRLFLLLFVFCCIISALCSLVIRKTGSFFGLIDKPGYRKIHDKPMPTGGGLGIWFAVLLPFLLFTILVYSIQNSIQNYSFSSPAPWIFRFLGALSFTLPENIGIHLGGFLYQSTRLWQLLGLGSVLVLLGTLDDRFGLSWKIRLFVQFLVAGLAVYFGWKATFFVDIPWLTSILSVLWIVALINSFNMLDNMDGLSAGVALICSIFFALVMFLFAKNPLSGEPQLFLGGFLLVLAGSLLGFLFHNFPSARIFMGDGGAYFIGFLLATTTLSATFVGKNTPPQAIFVPLCILAVPLYDLTSVVLIRLLNGKSPFVGDKNHYSHRLVALGLSRTGAVLTIYLTTTICSISALFLYQVNWFSACLIFVQIILIIALVAVLEYYGRRKSNN